MILTFSRSHFFNEINKGTKIHTIRLDKTNRWKAGNKIHFWYGNPRNVKSNPYQFAFGKCTKVETIIIDFQIEIVAYGNTKIYRFDELDVFAQNDGFENWDCLKDWFYEKNQRLDHGIFEGKIIFWELT
jgi:hypothetical protein